MEEFNKQLSEAVKTQKELNSNKNKFVGLIATMLIGLLGLLTALKPEIDLNCTAKNLYLLSLILISLGILCALIFLYSEVAYVKRVRNQQDIQMLWTSRDALKKTRIGSILKFEKLYSACEIGTYLCLILSMITLVMYNYYSL